MAGRILPSAIRGSPLSGQSRLFGCYVTPTDKIELFSHVPVCGVALDAVPQGRPCLLIGPKQGGALGGEGEGVQGVMRGRPDCFWGY
jgi:hypothetical protein